MIKHLLLLTVLFLSCGYSLYGQATTRGDAIVFNGDNFVDMGDVLDAGSNFTLEAWVKPNAISGTQTIISKVEGAAQQSYKLQISAGGELNFSIETSTSAGAFVNCTSAAGAIEGGRWYHVAATYDQSVMRLYINGREVNTTAEAGAITNSTAPFKLGAETDPGAANSLAWLTGEMDEVRVWSITRTATQIREQQFSV